MTQCCWLSMGSAPWLTWLGLVVSDVTVRGADVAPPEVRAFVQQHCLRCHGPQEANGQVDFELLTRDDQSTARHYKVWQSAARRVSEGEMPPEGEPVPSPAEREAFVAWSTARFSSVVAAPAEFRIRRLSAHEYRRTIESLIGFPLEVTVTGAEQTKLQTSLVMKLLPPDPSGPSGYTNDTSGTPISPVLWDHYGYIADVALLKLFDADHRAALEAYTGPIADSGLSVEQARALLTRFQRRAWRRDLSPEQTAPALAAIEGLQGSALTAALSREMKLFLLSPEFLYRGVLAESAPGTASPVDPFELAERLSYFLWADMPDEQLLAAAASGRLADRDHFHAEVERLLHAPPARSLSEIFGVQWLLLDEIDNLSREVPYVAALKGQPIEFLQDLIAQDRPLRELIDSRTEFVNLYLIKFYQPDSQQLTRTKRRDGVERETLPLERIELQATPGRGGLLTMPGVLIMNAGPIQRGSWVLQRILGERLGEPPPNVPPVKPALAGQNLTFRERFEQHRENKACASCHDRIDPLGFAFEAYSERGSFLLAPDADQQTLANVGQRGGVERVDLARLDTSGQLPTGETFADLAGLKSVLTGSQWPRVVENLVRQMLSYALCRELQLADEPVVEELTHRLSQPGATWGDLIHGITDCILFQQATFPPSGEQVAD